MPRVFRLLIDQCMLSKAGLFPSSSLPAEGDMLRGPGLMCWVLTIGLALPVGDSLSSARPGTVGRWEREIGHGSGCAAEDLKRSATVSESESVPVGGASDSECTSPWQRSRFRRDHCPKRGPICHLTTRRRILLNPQSLGNPTTALKVIRSQMRMPPTRRCSGGGFRSPRCIARATGVNFLGTARRRSLSLVSHRQGSSSAEEAAKKSQDALTLYHQFGRVASGSWRNVLILDGLQLHPEDRGNMEEPKWCLRCGCFAGRDASEALGKAARADKHVDGGKQGAQGLRDLASPFQQTACL
ncbi:hypothetical protein FB451DRAFT_1384262, partial [Mycena latifolia]